MSNLISVLVRRGREERLGLCAGGLTFTTLLSLVPLLAVSFALFTRLRPLQPVGEAIRDALLRALLPPAILNAVLKHVEHWAAKASGLTLLGSLFLLVSAVGLLFSVENAFNRIWQVKKQRGIGNRLGLYAIALLAGPVVLGASLWASSSLMTASGASVAAREPWLHHAIRLGPVVLGTAAFTCLFRYMPNTTVLKRHALVGGLLAAAAFEVGKHGFTLYLASVPTFRTFYGTFAPVLAFLVWVYYSWFVTLAAALVCASLARSGKARARRD